MTGCSLQNAIPGYTRCCIRKTSSHSSSNRAAVEWVDWAREHFHDAPLLRPDYTILAKDAMQLGVLLRANMLHTASVYYGIFYPWSQILSAIPALQERQEAI